VIDCARDWNSDLGSNDLVADVAESVAAFEKWMLWHENWNRSECPNGNWAFTTSANDRSLLYRKGQMMHEPQKISLISKKTRKAGKACVSWKVVKRVDFSNEVFQSN
jgi:hypothetical protein